MKGFRSRTLKDAWNGIKLAWNEANFRFQVCTLIAIVLLGYLLDLNTTEWSLVICCFAIVLTAELVNTAIENIADFVHPDFHPQIGKIKDIAAGAVLTAAFFSAITGSIIFIPKILNWLGWIS